jgi:ER lumen protein retaining receptor
VIQTAFYIDFAWVYYSRQRVKLRNGGIVDSDDMQRGWLVSRLMPKPRAQGGDDDVEHGEGGVIVPNNKWGSRGISVSADEGLDEHVEDAQPLADPAAFEDDLSEDEGVPAAVPRAEDSPWKDTTSRT